LINSKQGVTACSGKYFSKVSLIVTNLFIFVRNAKHFI
jgi:hypothetical protein